MKKNEKKEDLFSSLREMMLLVQLEEFNDRFQEDMKNRNRSSRKSLMIASIPLAIGGVASLITWNPLFVCLGVVGFGASTCVKIVKEGIDEDKKIAENDERLAREIERITKEKNDSSKEKVIYMEQAPSLDAQIFGVLPIVQHTDSDFYTDRIKEAMDEEVAAEERAKITIVGSKRDSGESVGADNDFEKNLSETPMPSMKIVEKIVPLAKDETQNKIVEEYEMYCIAYNLPAMTINSQEWDTLFDVIYHRLEEIDLTNRFYECMNFLLQYTLASSLLHKKEITIYSFVGIIRKLEILGFSKKDIQSIAEELNNKLSGRTKKVMNFQPKKV